MALKFGRSANREALAGGRERKDLKWRSVVAGIAATALAVGAWLGISNSNEKSTEAIQPPEDTVATSAQYEPTDAVAAATSNKKVEELPAAESSISLRERSDVAGELGNSILDSLGNAENNLAYYPGTTAGVRTSDKFNQDTYRAGFSIPTELDYYNTGELNPGDQQGGLYAFIDRKTDGSGRLTLSSAEGEYLGNNNMQDTNYAVELSVTQKAMNAAAADGIFNMNDVGNMLSN